MTKMLKNSILLQSVSTLLSPIVVSDLNKNFSGSTNLAKKGTDRRDFHTPIYTPPKCIRKCTGNVSSLNLAWRNFENAMGKVRHSSKKKRKNPATSIVQ